MARLPAWMLLDPDDRGGHAIYWARRGFPVLMLRGKQPWIAKRDGGRGLKDASCDEDQIRAWWGAHPEANIGGRMDGRIAFDVDVKSGGSWEQLADLTGGSRHRSGRGDGGGHLIYRLTTEQLLQVAQVKQRQYLPGIDLRIHDRGYIVLPPSAHPEAPEGSDGRYEIRADRDDYLPDQVWQRLLGAAEPAAGAGGAEGTTGGAGVHSLLTGLLAADPAPGTRNDTLTRICGHLAKRLQFQDAYLGMAVTVNRSWTQPLPADEVERTAQSIWDAEQARRALSGLDPADATEDSGWLVGDGQALFCPCLVGRGDEKEVRLLPWADFDLKALGVTLDAAGHAVQWLVTLTRHRDQERTDTFVEPADLADSRRLARWCIDRRVTIAPPERGQLGQSTQGVRLTRYLEHQKPPPIALVDRLGWNDGAAGFVTADELIRADQVLTHRQAGVYPAPKAIRDAGYRYGWDRDRDEARRVLAEVLSYQDPEVASVFGAWWALCLVKGQLQAQLALFPGMAVEAPSESGKTQGMFDLMLQLAGSANPPGMPTVPVIRDRVAAHRSGIVWIDDRDDLAPYHEILRAAPMEAAISKKAENRTDTLDFLMVAPVLISGEALGVSDQKALTDRFVQLRLPPGEIRFRKSVRPGADPDRPQWDDMLELREQYPAALGGLTAISGWLVQEALRHADQAIRWLADWRVGSGRHGDVLTLLRVGGRLLDAMLQGVPGERGELVSGHAERVDAWVAAQVDPGRENTLTKAVLPAALRAYGYPTRPEYAPIGPGSVTTPAFVEPDGTVRYRPELLADWWHRIQHGRINPRTESLAALVAQADTLAEGSPGSKPMRVWQGGHAGAKTRYRALSPELSLAIAERAWGTRPGTPGIRTRGVPDAILSLDTEDPQ